MILKSDRLMTKVTFEDMVNVAKKHKATQFITKSLTIPDSIVFWPIIIPPTSTTIEDRVSLGDFKETI